MPIRERLFVTLVALLTASVMAPSAAAQSVSAEVDYLVRGFPTLDDLESHLGSSGPPENTEAPPPGGGARGAGANGDVFPVSARWFTAAPGQGPFQGVTADTGSDEAPLGLLLTKMDAAQEEAGVLTRQISDLNNLPINKYLLDHVSAFARTDYGTAITGVFVNGIGFGSFQQTLRQNYGATFTLPLLQRFSTSTKWTRALSGWTISSSIGAMPQLSQVFQLQQLLNNLQMTWDVSLSYNISGGMARKVLDRQYADEAALAKAATRVSATRDDLLKRMALRIDTLSKGRPAADSRLTSLREIYPQFELYQARYDQATSCDERMEDFFTLKGLALSLLTLAGYDRSGNSENDLLQAWKKARFDGCGRS